MKYLRPAVFIFALIAAACMPACAAHAPVAEEEYVSGVQQEEQYAGQTEPEQPHGVVEDSGVPQENDAEPEETPSPEEAVAQYLCVTADGVNIRAGAGTGYARLGVAEKNTLYALCGREGGWYKTAYRGKSAYIYADYCTRVDMRGSEDEKIEAVIDEGCKLLGTPYVYGATRYHDGYGNLLSGFDKGKFDCSSLMQYIFKIGCGINLQVTTRTQIYQGRTVSWENIKRGDLLFFTNSSRKNNVGIERVGHVALYLGDGYILHTASDYAKIEKITPTRRAYFIQAQTECFRQKVSAA